MRLVLEVYVNRFLTAAALVPLTTLALAHQANAAVLCARAKASTGAFQDGAAVKLRATACKSSETVVDPVEFGLVGPAGPAGPEGPVGATGPEGAAGPGAVAKDANGTVIGDVFNNQGLLTAMLAVPDGRYFNVTLDNLGVAFSPGRDSFYFLSSDCSGQPLLVSFPDAQLTQTATTSGLSGDGTLYYPSTTGELQTTNSQRHLPSGNCLPNSWTFTFAPVAPPLSFLPPFHIETRAPSLPRAANE
jgi:hypothetical protein